MDPNRLLALLFVLLAALPARGATIVLQNGNGGYTGTTDAWLDRGSQSDNNGGSQLLRTQYSTSSGVRDTSVLRFELAGKIPPNQRILSAVLQVHYISAESMQDNNALTIKPHRVKPGFGWDENIYDGTAGHGVSWDHRNDAETLDWSGPVGGAWNDSLDDGNGIARIKPTGGTAPNAVEPGSWVSFIVKPTVEHWYAGDANNGFLLAGIDFEGDGSIAAGVYASRNHTLSSPNLKPILTIDYEPVPEPTALGWVAMGCWLLARRGR